MKFKIDENLPVEIAKLLTDEGYNAETVGDQGLRGAKDSILIEICKKEDRILVTLDTEYPSELIHFVGGGSTTEDGGPGTGEREAGGDGETAQEAGCLEIGNGFGD